MNREEAITTLKNYIERITGGMFPGEREILVEAFDAMRGPQPDPITGLMPCGCGGRVSIAFYHGWHGVPDLYQVDCFSCHVGTRPCQTAEQAKAAWNAAMGWRANK